MQCNGTTALNCNCEWVVIPVAEYGQTEAFPPRQSVALSMAWRLSGKVGLSTKPQQSPLRPSRFRCSVILLTITSMGGPVFFDTALDRLGSKHQLHGPGSRPSRQTSTEHPSLRDRFSTPCFAPSSPPHRRRRVFVRRYRTSGVVGAQEGRSIEVVGSFFTSLFDRRERLAGVALPPARLGPRRLDPTYGAGTLHLSANVELTTIRQRGTDADRGCRHHSWAPVRRELQAWNSNGRCCNLTRSR